MAKKSKRRRTRWNAKNAQAVLAEWRRSGLSAAAFARQEGYSAMRLRYWADRLPEPTPQGSVEFMPVPVPATGGGAARNTAAARTERGGLIELELNGVVLRVREDLDAERIEQLCAALMRGSVPC